MFKLSTTKLQLFDPTRHRNTPQVAHPTMASTTGTTGTHGISGGGPGNGAHLGPGPGPSGGILTGMVSIGLVFHFLDSPAEVLSAATACSRWRALACADWVWRARFRREKLLEKARAFEVALPPVPSGGQGQGGGGAAFGGSSSIAAATVSERDELTGVGLLFYAQVYVLQVRGAALRNTLRGPPYVFASPPLAPAPTAAALQGYKMRDAGVRVAVVAWHRDSAAAKARYGPIASWDVSDVTDMDALFKDMKDFNEDISRWNVSNVLCMSGMFRGAHSFNGNLSGWEVGRVQSMTFMFGFATSFNGDLSRWNVSSVKHMSAMFGGATSFDRQLDGAWSTSTATKPWMFQNSPGTIAGKTKHANGTVE